jgi:hypothetical protein
VKSIIGNKLFVNFPKSGVAFVQGERFRWQRQFYIPFQVLIEIFAADATIELIDFFHY